MPATQRFTRIVLAPIRRITRQAVKDELAEIAQKGREDLVQEYGEEYVREIEGEVRAARVG